MKKIGIIIITLFLLSCKKEKAPITNTSNQDTINSEKSIVDNSPNKDIKSQELFRAKIDNANSIKNLNNFDFDNDTIYTICKNYILKINIKDHTFNKCNLKFSIFPNPNKIINFDYLFDFKKIDNQKYILQNFNSIVIYDEKNGSVSNTYSNKKIVYSYLDNKSSLICDYEGVKLLNENLKVVDSLKIEFMDDFFIKSDFGFSYFEGSSDPFNNFFIQKEKIKLEKGRPLQEIAGISDIDNFYVSLVTKDYIIGFYYTDRSNLYFINKKDYKIVGKVYLNNELTLSKEAVQNEEGRPNLKIIKKNNSYFILGINKNQELILLKLNF